MPLTISVVMPVRNARTLVVEQLRALAAQDHDGPWELVVADNGSMDGTQDVVRSVARELGLGLELIDAADLPGAGHARNVGARATTGEYLLFIDADDRAHPGWLSALCRAAPDSDALCGALQRFRVNRAGVEHLDQNGTVKLPEIAGFLPFAWGANCGMRRSIFEELGGFDDRLIRCEDVDLFWRLQLAGHELSFVPDALLYVRERSSSWQLARQRYDWGRWDVELYRRYREHGMQGSDVEDLARDVSDTLLRFPTRLRSAYGRRRTLLDLAVHAGRVRQSITTRTMFL